MKTRNLIQVMCLCMVSVMGVSVFAATPGTQAEAATLLRQVQSTATSLTSDAELLESFARGSISRESHLAQVMQIKDHINTMGEQLARLQAIRHVAAPWQQQAIDSILPTAVNLATHTQAAILHLNETGKPVWDPQYTDHVRAISNRSGEVKEAVNLHLELADTQDRVEQLQDRVNSLGS